MGESFGACYDGRAGDTASTSCFLAIPHPPSSFPPLLCGPGIHSNSEKIDLPLGRRNWGPSRRIRSEGAQDPIVRSR